METTTTHTSAPKTAAEAIAAGWVTYDYKLEMGYMSKKVRYEDMPLCVAGGSRKGEMYFRENSGVSNRYGIARRYIRPPQ